MSTEQPSQLAQDVAVINLKCRPEPFCEFFNVLVNKIPDTHSNHLQVLHLEKFPQCLQVNEFALNRLGRRASQIQSLSIGRMKGTGPSTKRALVNMILMALEAGPPLKHLRLWKLGFTAAQGEEILGQLKVQNIRSLETIDLRKNREWWTSQ